jgi:hypothetical protein
MASGRRGKAGDTLNIFVLRNRTLDALRRAGITTVGQARNLSEADLLGVANVGPTIRSPVWHSLVRCPLGTRRWCTCTRRAPDSPR